jgi:hypothetical protein
MTYYKKGRAKVFAAGAFGLVDTMRSEAVDLMMENLWAKFSKPSLARWRPHPRQ